MERKNTMLLTVIAVATLLVAVVGATFAYFTASNAENTSTTVTVTTESSSTATATNNGAVSLYVSAAEMLEDDELMGKTYTAKGDADSLIAGSLGTASADDSDGGIIITITNGSDTQDRVCSYDLVYTLGSIVSASGTSIDDMDSLVDLSLLIQPSGYDDSNALIEKTYDVIVDGKQLVEGETDVYAFTIASHEYTVDAEDKTTHTITYDAAMALLNSTDEQDDIAGISLNGTVSVENFSCVFETPVS